MFAVIIGHVIGIGIFLKVLVYRGGRCLHLLPYLIKASDRPCCIGNICKLGFKVIPLVFKNVELSLGSIEDGLIGLFFRVNGLLSGSDGGKDLACFCLILFRGCLIIQHLLCFLCRLVRDIADAHDTLVRVRLRIFIAVDNGLLLLDCCIYGCDLAGKFCIRVFISRVLLEVSHLLPVVADLLLEVLGLVRNVCKIRVVIVDRFLAPCARIFYINVDGGDIPSYRLAIFTMLELHDYDGKDSLALSAEVFFEYRSRIHGLQDGLLIIEGPGTFFRICKRGGPDHHEVFLRNRLRLAPFRSVL